ncbi:hypothetical protein [Longimicrobium sp.]|uniref:hypothetical protein n=1 Tax=Longimicrobium sp. TaxID=2029185 RepID=UPI002E33BC2C|nr:hypothetical protein [Longimicrobium sp.]HEX6038890.1 hypothetical protein [Longimicrobium sp.]
MAKETAFAVLKDVDEVVRTYHESMDCTFCPADPIANCPLIERIEAVLTKAEAR